MTATLNGGVASYFTRKQKCVALSSAEAEYIAASEVTKAIVWLRNSLKELLGNSEQDEPTVIYEDHQERTSMTEAEASGKRTKHTDVRYHCVREAVQTGAVCADRLGEAACHATHRACTLRACRATHHSASLFSPCSGFLRFLRLCFAYRVATCECPQRSLDNQSTVLYQRLRLRLCARAATTCSKPSEHPF